ncbi:N-acetylmuramic acid 6-phosphate etherase [Pontibacter sp. JH31]|uniref:N-acetylmuramic acid 6-phosphate etherase n=1 Tax=Pontibacter aquaedesilientis TaxID=2766980 RepID=A0ABR7XKT1_9BACT|nr:N-acetylmuramic acid 6-phosphate etherase [Pontibacter aquaedesilientis]MBD1398566.1 N-acetylmuramic acid 6-phosphate etherase [Pontibacter aquaedesilientis]
MSTTTESESNYDSLERMPVLKLLQSINQEDKTVPFAVERAIPQIETLVKTTVDRLSRGGRLFYIGAGTSGRLGIVDASECPPTYGVPHGMVIGIIAGGDGAIRKAVEFAEDDTTQAWKDLQEHHITPKDIVVGIAASGNTPYVVGGLEACRRQGIATGCIVCNANSNAAATADCPVEVITGPEFVTGSTRMKAGTAQKLVLNMLTTATMVQLGHVKGNKMVDMQLSNTKLVERGIRMVMEELQLAKPEAAALLKKYGSVRAAIEAYRNGDYQV